MSISGFIRRHSRTVAALAFLFAYSVGISFATPPVSPYQPGATLQPSCLPGSTNCTTQILPSQTGNTGKLLTTDGSTTTWSLVPNTSLQNSTITINGSAIALGGSVSNLALVTNPLSQFASTTSAQLASTISDETGTGTLVYATSPTLTTPNIGAATGTSLALSGGASFLGNVGVGTATAAFPISVQINSAGTLNTIAEFRNDDYTAGTRSFIRVRNWLNAGASYSSYFGQGQDAKTYIIANDPGRGGDIVIDGTNGYVGVGTASPGSRLTIKTTTVSSNDALSVTDGVGTIRIGHWDTINNRFEFSGKSTYFVQYGASEGLSFGTNGTTRLTIDSSGNIGIPDLAGVGNRCVYADSTGQLNVKGFDCGSASGGDNLGDHTATQNILLNNNWLSNDGGAEGIRIDNSGNVGIGTASPTRTLQIKGVSGSGTQGFEVLSPLGNRLGILAGAGSSNPSEEQGYFQMGDTGVVKIVLHTAGSSYFNGGNVGIGDTSPASLFTVGNGDLFQVNSSGAIVAGSITSGFGSIDVGADSITGGAANFTTGAFSGAVTLGTGTSAYTFGGSTATQGALTDKDLTLRAWSPASGTNEYAGDLILQSGNAIGNGSGKLGSVLIRTGTAGGTSTSAGTTVVSAIFNNAGLTLGSTSGTGTGALYTGAGNFSGNATVSKATAYFIANRTDNTSEVGVQFATSGTPKWYNYMIAGDATDTLNWYYGGNKMTLTTAGNLSTVGSVTGGAASFTSGEFSGNILVQTSTGTGIGAGVWVNHATTSGFVSKIGDVNKAYFYSSASNAIVESVAGNGIQLVAGGSVAMTLASNQVATFAANPVVAPASGDAKLSLNAAGSTAYVNFVNGNGGTWGMGTSFSGSSTTFDLYNFGTNTTVMKFNYSTNAVSFSSLISCGGIQTNGSGTMSCTSDETLKDKHGAFTKGLAAIRQINPESFSWKQDSGLYDDGIIYYGFIAQNVQAALPEAISISTAGKLQVSQLTLLATTINAVKELDIKVQSLPDFADQSLAVKIADFLRGIAERGEATVDTVNVKKICIDGLCLTRQEIETIMAGQGGSSDSTGSSQGGSPAPQATCSDGIQNQDETGVDTGGVCTTPSDPSDDSVPPPSDIPPPEESPATP